MDKVISESQVRVLYADERLCIVDKPSGLAVHPGWVREPETALSQVAALTGRYVYPVHRLDRATSGVLMFAFDSETARLGQALLKETSSAKIYLALVRGITPERGVIDHPIAKSKAHEKREARTAFEHLGSFERYSLVRARTFTGRLHQIRRHLKFISHPLIGDTNYGKGEHNRLFRERFNLQRLVLHAAQLKFLHPHTREPLLVSAGLPNSLAVLFKSLGLYEVAQAATALPWPETDVLWQWPGREVAAATPGQASTEVSSGLLTSVDWPVFSDENPKGALRTFVLLKNGGGEVAGT